MSFTYQKKPSVPGAGWAQRKALFGTRRAVALPLVTSELTLQAAGSRCCLQDAQPPSRTSGVLQSCISPLSACTDKGQRPTASCGCHSSGAHRFALKLLLPHLPLTQCALCQLMGSLHQGSPPCSPQLVKLHLKIPSSINYGEFGCIHLLQV